MLCSFFVLFLLAIVSLASASPVDTTFYFGFLAPGSPETVEGIGGNLAHFYSRGDDTIFPHWLHYNVAPSVKFVTSWKDIYTYGWANGNTALSGDCFPNTRSGADDGWPWHRDDALGEISDTHSFTPAWTIKKDRSGNNGSNHALDWAYYSNAVCTHESVKRTYQFEIEWQLNNVESSVHLGDTVVRVEVDAARYGNVSQVDSLFTLYLTKGDLPGYLGSPIPYFDITHFSFLFDTLHQRSDTAWLNAKVFSYGGSNKFNLIVKRLTIYDSLSWRVVHGELDTMFERELRDLHNSCITGGVDHFNRYARIAGGDEPDLQNMRT